jgi:hypothetical protein
MTVFFTVLAGFLTFVLGQLAIKLFVEPIHEFRRVIADIAFALNEYANIYCNPGNTGDERESERERKVSSELRALSSRLNAQMYIVPAFDITVNLFRLPSRQNVDVAATHLIGLSNSVYKTSDGFADKNMIRAQRICDALGIYIPESKRLELDD